MKPSSRLCSLLFLAALGLQRADAADPSSTSAPFSSRTIRLQEIAVHRYVPSTNGSILERRYLLDARNGLTHVEDVTVPVAVTIPAEAFDKVLIFGAAWTAYRQLGPVAFANFEFTTELPILIADRMQFEVRVSDNARLDGGKLSNISTRGSASTAEKLVAGFVVTEQHRRVLVRAVGPSLAQFGVSGAMADPYVTIYKNRTPIYYNGDWSTRPDAAEIAATAVATGAFALPANSKDAALLIELEPGVYTAQVEPENGGGGVALVEVYAVP